LHCCRNSSDSAEALFHDPVFVQGWTPFSEFFPSVEVFECFPTLTFVALNSEPALSDDALLRSIDFFDGASPAVPRVFCTHRGLLPVPGRRIKKGDLLPNSGEVLLRLLQAGVDVVLSAHLHRAHAWNIGNGNRSLILVSAPSLLDSSGSKTTGLVSIDFGDTTTVSFHPLDGNDQRTLLTVASSTEPDVAVRRHR
jgi:hypothetical protein